MSLKIKIAEEEREFSRVNRIQDKGNNVIFELTSPGSEGEYKFPTAFPNTSIENTAKVFIFKNKHFGTRDIIQFRIESENALTTTGKPSSDGYIGYFFSFQLLKEDDLGIVKQFIQDASKSDKELAAINTFLLFAVEAILKNEQGKVSLPPKGDNVEDPYKIKIRDLYKDDDLVILCINEKMLKYPDQFDMDTYLCDLYKYGFYWLKEHETKVRYNELQIISNKYYKDHTKQTRIKHIKATRTNNTIDFTSNSFYQTLLYELIHQDSKFPTSFIILYQVIELLKDKVLKNEIKYLPNNDDNKSGYEIRKAVNKKMNKLSTELGLIKRLFSTDYSQINEDDQKFLKIPFEKFLKKIETFDKQEVKTPDETEVNEHQLADMLYQLRNNIVHNYSIIVEKNIEESLINNIRMSFEYLIIDLLHTYKDDSKKASI